MLAHWQMVFGDTQVSMNEPRQVGRATNPEEHVQRHVHASRHRPMNYTWKVVWEHVAD